MMGGTDSEVPLKMLAVTEVIIAGLGSDTAATRIGSHSQLHPSTLLGYLHTACNPAAGTSQ